MSEYQYYEFQTIDRPLTAEQQAALRKLSKRVELSATRAAFNYAYGGSIGEPLHVLEQHFDALLYIANWGSKQLAFRLPRGSIESAQLEPYLLGDEESYVGDLQVTRQHLILNLETREEEGFGWIEGEGLLDPLIPLREARGETHVGIALLRQLRELGGASTTPAAPMAHRSFAEIQAGAEHQRQLRVRREREAAERARLTRLEALAQREPHVWASIPALLAKRTASGYDEGVALLVELRDLAVQREQRAAFDARLAELTAPYAASPALQRRLKEQRLA